MIWFGSAVGYTIFFDLLIPGELDILAEMGNGRKGFSHPRLYKSEDFNDIGLNCDSCKLTASAYCLLHTTRRHLFLVLVMIDS